MILQNKDLEAIYLTAIAGGHPDPVGLLARMKILSGFDTDKSTNKGFGLALLPNSIVGADDTPLLEYVQQTVAYDVAEFTQYQNIEEMHLASQFSRKDKGSKKAKGFISKLDKHRSEISKRLGLADAFDGESESISNAVNRQDVQHIRTIAVRGLDDRTEQVGDRFLDGEQSSPEIQTNDLPDADIDEARERGIRKIMDMMDNDNG